MHAQPVSISAGENELFKGLPNPNTCNGREVVSKASRT
jgi:hypothetical protein